MGYGRVKTASLFDLKLSFKLNNAQGFYDSIGNQALSMGWNSWWDDWDLKSDFFASLSLPRQLKLAPSGDHILIGPHPNVLGKLRGKKLVDKNGNCLLKSGNPVAVPDGMAYIRLALKQPVNGSYAAIYLKINHPAYEELGVRTSSDGLELVKNMK